MLFGFLFRTIDEWRDWRRIVSEAPGKIIFHVSDVQPSGTGGGLERHSALDEVETFDDETDNEMG